MTTKESLLTLLESQQGSFVSGEDLAASLSVSRAAVCKAVKALRQEGYAIEAITNRGYRLSPESDILSAQGIKKHLRRDFSIHFFPSTGSTNTTLRALADHGSPEGTVVVSNAQDTGRGRYGRVFYSPADTGIYLSVLLRPTHTDPRQTVTLTAAAAVALCQAIEAVSGVSSEIKWVNDIYLDSKKVCGILTEAAFHLESGAPEYAVVGVGINAYRPGGGFPPELSEIARFLWEKTIPDGKNRLAAEFLDRFWSLYAAGDPNLFLEDYRRRNFVVGKDIIVSVGDTRRKAHATGIDDQCRLQIRYDSGEVALLSYGEVHIAQISSE